MKHILNLLLFPLCAIFLAIPNIRANSSNPPEDQLLSLVLSLHTDLTCHGDHNGLAVVAAVGGVPPFVYVWSNGTLGPINANLSAGVYTATVTDLLGATATLNVTIDEPSQLQVNVAAQANINCLNIHGSATVNTNGGTGASSVIWSNGQVGNSVSNLNAGVYIATATDGNGCTSILPVTITADVQLPNVNVNLSGDLQLDCLTPDLTLSGQGSATGNGIGYLWTTANGHIVAGGSTLNALVDASGEYTLHVTNNNNGCSSTANVNVTADLNLPLVNIAAGANVDLQLDCLTPQITLDASASANGAGIGYLWTTANGHIVSGGNTTSPTVDLAGNYVLHITNSNNGCSSTAAVNVTAALDLPTVNATVSGQLNCNNSSLVIDASASSQGSNFLYLWTTVNGHIVSGGNTLTPTVNAAGTYTLVVTNTNSGCTASVNVNVTGTATVNVSLTNLVNVSCFGMQNGSATLNVSGGVGPYTYLWSNGMTTASVTGLAAGLYIASITDAQGCQSVVNVNITQPTQMNATTTTTPASGAGQNNGSASITVTGGTGPYTYQWSNGMTGNNVNGLGQGSYTVTITDASGCSINITVMIGNSAGCSLTLNVSVQKADCNQSNGQATATATNGSGTLTFNWSNGMSGAHVTGLAVGTYIVTASDNQGCTAIGAAIITSQDITAPVVIAQNATIYLDAQGNANLTTSMINNGSSDACSTISLILDNYAFDCSDLGTHVVVMTATDQSGNTATATATVTVVDSIAAVLHCPSNIEVNNGNSLVTYNQPTMEDNCSNNLNAAVILTGGLASGSVFPNGVTTVSYVALNASGATANCSFTVTVSGGLSVNATSVSPSCAGENNGSATINITGGSGNYHYLWINANGQTSATATGLAAGIYTVVIVDELGNVMVQDVTVTDPTPINLSVTVVADNCSGVGSVDVTITGGTAPYTYAWYDVNGNVIATTEDLTDVPSGDYVLVVTDAHGCTFTTGPININLVTGVVETELSTAGTVSLAPNPTADGQVMLTLSLPQSSFIQVETYTMSGQKVGSTQEGEFQKGQFSLNMASFVPGQYLVKVITDDHTYIKKVIRLN